MGAETPPRSPRDHRNQKHAKGIMEYHRLTQQAETLLRLYDIELLFLSTYIGTVQASPAELRQALQEMHAIQLDGAWRSVDKAYMESLLETALFLAVQQGWSHTALPQADLVEGLKANGHDARLLPCWTFWDQSSSGS